MVAIPTTFTLSNSVCPSTSKSALASILPAKVDTPDTFVVVALNCTAVATPVTFNSSVVVPSTIFAPPARTLIPYLAVTIPIASTFLTSSYVNTPPIVALPLTSKFELISTVLLNVETPETVTESKSAVPSTYKCLH